MSHSLSTRVWYVCVTVCVDTHTSVVFVSAHTVQSDYFRLLRNTSFNDITGEPVTYRTTILKKKAQMTFFEHVKTYTSTFLS